MIIKIFNLRPTILQADSVYSMKLAQLRLHQKYSETLAAEVLSGLTVCMSLAVDNSDIFFS